MAAPLAEIDRDADALVPVVFDGFDLAMAHPDGQAAAFGDLGLGGGSAAGCGPGRAPGRRWPLQAVAEKLKRRFGHSGASGKVKSTKRYDTNLSQPSRPDMDHGSSKTRRRDRKSAKASANVKVEPLQDMGKELFELSRDRLRRWTCRTPCCSAFLEAQRLTSHGAIAPPDAVHRQGHARASMPRPSPNSWRRNSRRIHRCQGRVPRLGELARAPDRRRSAVTDWLGRHPGGDAQQFRQLIRNARKEEQG
jgi:ribosome-associated protein